MTIPESNDDKIRKVIEENIEASKPVLAELARAGFKVDSISDLYINRLDYRKAIPLLQNWLPKVKNRAVKEEIVRALSVPWAKGEKSSKLLIAEFNTQVSDPLLQWVIGNALSVVADESVLNDICELIQDKLHGKAREMLVVALGNMELSKVEPFLIELLDDEDLVGYAIMALGKLKSKKAYPFIERLSTNRKSWIRKEVQKALRKIVN